jgi:hypothetical protein
VRHWRRVPRLRHDDSSRLRYGRSVLRYGDAQRRCLPGDWAYAVHCMRHGVHKPSGLQDRRPRVRGLQHCRQLPPRRAHLHWERVRAVHARRAVRGYFVSYADLQCERYVHSSGAVHARDRN